VSSFRALAMALPSFGEEVVNRKQPRCPRRGVVCVASTAAHAAFGSPEMRTMGDRCQALRALRPGVSAAPRWGTLQQAGVATSRQKRGADCIFFSAALFS